MTEWSSEELNRFTISEVKKIAEDTRNNNSLLEKTKERELVKLSFKCCDKNQYDSHLKKLVIVEVLESIGTNRAMSRAKSIRQRLGG